MCWIDVAYARKYTSPRNRPLTPEEQATRRLAYALKTADPEAVAIAAAEMAPYVPPGAVLIPVPNSLGDVGPNRVLANAIAKRVACRVVAALARARPVESSCVRRRQGRLGLTPEEHGITRVKFFLPLVPTFFIDNVVTTGSTLRAARAAMGYGDGLVFADASSWKTARKRELARGGLSTP